MITLKKILFPTDFSRCAEQALMHALYLAEQFGAELHVYHANLLHAYDPNNPDYKFPTIDRQMQARLEDAIADHLKAKISKHDTGDIVIRQVQERGISAPPVILTYADDNDIDLIVMGTHGRRGLGHFIVGSVAEEVVRMAPCPVLTVGRRGELRSSRDIQRILVPVDFSEHSQNALAYAKEIAKIYDAGLQLLHVIEAPVYPSFYADAGASLLALGPDIAAQATRELERLVSETKGPEVAAEVHIIEGRAGAEIVKFANSQRIDLIIIATHGLTGLRHLLIGSVAEKVARHASCPVFTVKAFGKSLLGS